MNVENEKTITSIDYVIANGLARGLSAAIHGGMGIAIGAVYFVILKDAKPFQRFIVTALVAESAHIGLLKLARKGKQILKNKKQ